MNLEELKAQAQEALEANDVAKAKELIAQIKAINEQNEEKALLSSELEELTAKSDVAQEDSQHVSDDEDVQEPKQDESEAVEEVAEDKLEEEKDEKRTEINADMKMKEIKLGQTDDFENYIRTQGTELRGLDTANGSAVVPVEVATDVLELKDTQADLTKYVTSQTVGTGKGRFPIARRSRSILATKTELAEIAEINEPLFIDVEYACETRIGQIALSNELIEDAVIDVVGYAKKQMQRMVTNTNNKGVIDVISAFSKKVANGIDELKRVINVDLDPELDLKIVLNQDAYNYIDTLKDTQGRYLLQDAIAFESGKSLFGKEVIVVSNKVASTPSTSKGFVFVGDLQEAVAYFKRTEITAEWEKFDAYSKGLAVGVRSDYKQIDAEAGFMVTLKDAPTAP
ncbi:HK97 family phage major capsid protein [Enterococcus sp. DIV2402]|uniref:HK97 family phage major capsid protein n=1 Tax=Candidatus Enterococcus lowellii TaxID=2230877 RepID=A0ABZ2SPL9_9ENTE|nr:phage major capsid protein [Enterococcus sp. DIV2402]MBO0463512.1 phage major capsid protein [Enterococcus sp. DIV2402]